MFIHWSELPKFSNGIQLKNSLAPVDNGEFVLCLMKRVHASRDIVTPHVNFFQWDSAWKISLASLDNREFLLSLIKRVLPSNESF